MLEPTVVSQRNRTIRRPRRQGEREQSDRVAAGLVLHQPKHVGAKKTAQVPDRIDQRDASGRRGAGQHRRRQRPEVGAIDCWPIMPMISAIMIIVGWSIPMKIQAPSPAAQTRHAAATCFARSPLRSEW